MGCASSRRRVPRLRLDQLSVYDQIGTGHHTSVYVVRNKCNGTVCALKLLPRRHHTAAAVRNEVQLMRRCAEASAEPGEPTGRVKWFLDLYGYCADEHQHYILMELGNETLRHYIEANNGFAESDIQFYVANLLCALDILHRNRILHRDVKPENIVVGMNGYLKLIDFGASYLADTAHDMCRLRTGTRRYLAPEVKRGDVQTCCTDFYSLGVTILFMATGYGSDMEQKPRLGDILDSLGLSEAACSFLVNCLRTKPKDRIGSQHGVEDLMSHEWMLNLEWDSIVSQTAPPPLYPTDSIVSHYSDFDERYYDL